MEKIQFDQDGSKGRYFILNNGKTAAELTTSIADSKLWIIDHTAVDDQFRNSGYGLRLVEHVVNEAIEKGAQILPLCPFARSVFDKRPDWNSVRR